METHELESAEAPPVPPPPDGDETFQAIFDEGSRSTCLEDADLLLRARLGNVEARVLGVVSHAISSERRKKLALHRRWIEHWARGVRRERVLREACRRIAAGERDAPEIALAALMEIDGA